MRRILTLAVSTELDVLLARQRSRQITSHCGFTPHDQVRISTVVSELARNIYIYAVLGRIEFSIAEEAAVQSLVIRIEDQGPGIENLDLILAGQYHAETGMGLGILGAHKLMDDCVITTVRNEGTTIVLKKHLPAGAPLLTPAMIGAFGQRLEGLQDNLALSEVQRQNRELIETLAALEAKQDELLQLTQELRVTNQTVVALNAELGMKAEQLQRADVRKDEFLAILAHELRNPIAAAAMAASVLETGSASTTRVVELGQVVSRQASHMSRLVEDLLDVSRVTRGLVAIEKKPVDMRVVVETAVEQLSPLIAAKAHSLVSSSASDACYVSGDMTRLIQVGTNLLTNAARYTPDGGQIVVELLVGENTVTLQVTDNGVGIDPDLMPRLFDLYVQAEVSSDGKAGGLGLGLTLVKSIVELHDGSVTADSQGKGKGSKFQVNLPRLR